jgi:hypothetical protein
MTSPTPLSAPEVTIAQVISAVQYGVLAAQSDPRFDIRLVVDRLELTLLVVRKADIGVDAPKGFLGFVPLVGGGANIAEEDLATLRLNLVHTPGDDLTLAFPEWLDQVDDQIAAGILAMLDGVKAARNAPVTFSLSQASIELKFQVVRAAKLALWVVGGGTAHGKSHTLTLYLKRLSS